MIRFSDSMPIKVYKNGEPTFHEQLAAGEPGIEENCWKEPANADDEIQFQGYEDNASSFVLLAPEDWTPVFGTGFVAPNAEVTETSFYAFLLAVGAINKHAYQEYELAAGEKIKFKVFVSLNGAITPTLQFVMMDDITDSSNIVTINTSGEHEVELTATDDSNRLRITVSLTNVSSIVVSPFPSAKEYTMILNDEKGDVIDSIPMERDPEAVTLEFSTADLAAAATTNANGGTTNWVGGTVNMSLGGAGTRKAYLKYFPVDVPGEQRVRMFIETTHTQPFGSANITSATLRVGLFDADYNFIGGHTFNVDISTPFGVTHYFDFYIDEDAAFVGVDADMACSGACTESAFLDYMRLSYNLYPETAVFAGTIIPEDYEVIEGLIQVDFVDEDETLIAYTGLIDVQQLHPDSFVILFKNKIDYAGLKYSIDNPPTFMKRVIAKFWEPKFPQDEESDTDSEGVTQMLSNTVKEQRQMEFDPIPPYEIRKLILILNQSSTYIKNVGWTKEDSVEHDKLEDEFALYPAKVWLTLKNDNVTNA